VNSNNNNKAAMSEVEALCTPLPLPPLPLLLPQAHNSKESTSKTGNDYNCNSSCNSSSGMQSKPSSARSANGFDWNLHVKEQQQHQQQ